MPGIKKAALLLLAGAFAIVMGGCGGGTPEGQPTEGGKPLRVGTSIDFAPFEFRDETTKEYKGFDIDLINAIGKELGRNVEISDIGFEGLIPALSAKHVEVVISGMTITDERKQKVAFSDPYYESGITLVVREDETGIRDFRDLEGRRVAVQTGTTCAAEARKIRNVEIKELNGPIDCFMELKAGGVDAVINDRPVNDYYIVESGAVGIKALPGAISVDAYGIAMARDNKKLQKDINEALRKLRENGEYDRIYKRWFGDVK